MQLKLYSLFPGFWLTGFQWSDSKQASSLWLKAQPVQATLDNCHPKEFGIHNVTGSPIHFFRRYQHKRWILDRIYRNLSFQAKSLISDSILGTLCSCPVTKTGRNIIRCAVHSIVNRIVRRRHDLLALNKSECRRIRIEFQLPESWFNYAKLVSKKDPFIRMSETATLFSCRIGLIESAVSQYISTLLLNSTLILDSTSKWVIRWVIGFMSTKIVYFPH